jgi:hypothetical protein
MANWQERFDKLLKGMSEGEPYKAEKREKPAAQNARPNLRSRLQSHSHFRDF